MVKTHRSEIGRGKIRAPNLKAHKADIARIRASHKSKKR